MTDYPKPNKEKALNTLRPFQQKTVEHVVARLFDEKGSKRFLVADEVGLGKTLVARGVIAEFIDKIWDKTGRIDILYMCSNTALANENISKLRIGGDQFGKQIPATRFTLLPERLHEFHPKLNFISVTPSTAVSIRGWGHAEERVVLWKLLEEKYKGIWLSNFLQGPKSTERWRHDIKVGPSPDPELAKRFHDKLSTRKSLLDELAAMEEPFARQKPKKEGQKATNETSPRACQLTGALRTLLAGVCIDAAQPDLIILDEFQRFKDLLSTGVDGEISAEAELAQQLFDYVTPEGNKVAMLLLSATPYRMFSTSDEAATDKHYEDFLQTMRFLLDDQDRFEELGRTLKRYNSLVHHAAASGSNEIESVRDSLQAQLLSVLSRHERVASTVDRDAMLVEKRIPSGLEQADIRHYLASEDLGRAIGARDIVELWKSAPYLYNFAKGYEFKRYFDEKNCEKTVRDAFDRAQEHQLNPESIEAYGDLEPANGRLRSLIHETTGNDQWRMLWLPPSLPYWPLKGPWEKNPYYTKSLIFSSWNVVPDAISALLSYSVERRMVTKGEEEKVFSYRQFIRKRRPLLRFPVKDGTPNGMTTFLLLYPCLRLAKIHPLSFQKTPNVLDAVREQVEKLVQGLSPRQEGDRADPRWYWAAPLLLDADLDREPLWKSLLQPKKPPKPAEEEPAAEVEEHSQDGADDLEGQDESSGLALHVALARRVIAGEIDLGAFPDDLVDVLTDLTLGGPGTVWARTLSGFRVSEAQMQVQASAAGDALRTMFNEPAVIEMLQEQDGDFYWRATLRYAVQGNLQAVLDEYAHILWEPTTWSGRTADESAAAVTKTAIAAISTRTSTVAPDYYSTGKTRVLKEKDGPRFRTSFALRYATLKGSGEASEKREDIVRDAFKSPFYPFVLASTSVGQEGLDFHPWCHSVWHWNLPGNPVDLEQREGRVHRFKGHAIRKNVASSFGQCLGESWSPGKDPWQLVFDAADSDARAKDESELIPYWLSPGAHKIERCVPLLPLSREHERLEQLKRSLAIYRFVFGQPRQEELVELLSKGNVSVAEMEKWMVRLSV